MMRSCIACNGTAFKDYSKELVECEGCGLVVARDIPSDAELTKLYQQDYFFGKEYFDYEADRPALEQNFRNRLQHLGHYLGPQASLVEVGCAYGYFLNLVKDRVSSHTGYDVSVEGVRFAKTQLGVNASNEDFLKAKIDEASVDMAVMWDVIEHLPRPEEFIAKIARILKPGGYLAFTTGDISALVPKIRREKWRMVHPPTHIYYFTPESAEKLLAKYGLKVTSVRYAAIYRNASSVINQLKSNRIAQGKSAKPFEWLLKLAETTGFGKLNIPLNTFDIMEVIAVKQ